MQVKSFGSGRVASLPGIATGAPWSRLLCFLRRFCRRSGRVVMAKKARKKSAAKAKKAKGAKAKTK